MVISLPPKAKQSFDSCTMSDLAVEAREHIRQRRRQGAHHSRDGGDVIKGGAGQMGGADRRAQPPPGLCSA
jgi:hypothetical protein